MPEMIGFPTPSEARPAAPELPKVTDDKSYDTLAQGAMFLDPQGQKRQKPFTISDDKGYDAVPEGAHFVGPDGTTRTKPVAEGIGVGAQTLYDMASNEKEQRSILSRKYGADNVKSDSKGQLFVEKDGKVYRPGAGGKLERGAAFVASEAAPMAGGVGGAIAGAAAGNLPGALAGAGAGSAAGQGFNDLVLKISGDYDRSGVEEAKGLAGSAALGVAGEGAGRVIGAGVKAAAPSLKGAAERIKGAGPAAARWFLGADPEGLGRAAGMAGQGINVPVQSWAQQAPMMKKYQDWAKIFGHDPVGKTAEPFYEGKAGQILEHLGVPKSEIGSMTEPSGAVSFKAAGERLQSTARTKMAEQDAALDGQIKSVTDAIEKGGFEEAKRHGMEVARLTSLADESRKTAGKLIDEGWKDIDQSRKALLGASAKGEAPGDLARTVEGKIWDMRRAVSKRAQSMYKVADTVAGKSRIDMTDVAGTAQKFLENLPEDLRANHPALVRQVAALADNPSLTFGEARFLRSMLRDVPDWGRLDASFREGPYKLLANKVDGAIHGKSGDLRIKAAAEELDKADAFYRKEMARFKDATVQNLVDKAKAGMPPDTGQIARQIMEPGHTERLGEMKRILGPQVFDRVVAADLQNMLDASKSLAPGQIDSGRFAAEVLKRVQNGTLDVAYGKDTAKLVQQHAARLEQMGGRLDVQAVPGDTFGTLMKRMVDAEGQIKDLAKRDPLGSMEKELKRAQQEHAQTLAGVTEDRKADALGFLTKPTALASESAERILDHPELLEMSIARFGTNSPEINLLRQTAARDLLQGGLKESGKLRGTLARKYTDEQQALLFPGAVKQDLQELAKNMEFLMPPGDAADVHSALSGGSRVVSPHLPGSEIPGIKQLSALIPAPIRRAAMSEYLNRMSGFITSPGFVKWAATGLRGSPAERQAVKAEIQRQMAEGARVGGPIGTGAANLLGGPGGSDQAPPAPADWRSEYQQKYGTK